MSSFKDLLGKKAFSASEVWNGVPDNDLKDKALEREWVKIEDVVRAHKKEMEELFMELDDVYGSNADGYRSFLRHNPQYAKIKSRFFGGKEK